MIRDGTRGAPRRGFVIATQALEGIASEVARLEAELIELEVAVAADQQEASTETDLQSLESGIRKVLKEMVDSGNVAETDLIESTSQMSLLFSNAQ